MHEWTNFTVVAAQLRARISLLDLIDGLTWSGSETREESRMSCGSRARVIHAKDAHAWQIMQPAATISTSTAMEKHLSACSCVWHHAGEAARPDGATCRTVPRLKKVKSVSTVVAPCGVVPEEAGIAIYFSRLPVYLMASTGRLLMACAPSGREWSCADSLWPTVYVMGCNGCCEVAIWAVPE